MTDPLSKNDTERLAAGAASLRQSLDGISPDHPTPDELAAYVDGSVDPINREMIESHIEVCSTCAEDIEDLRNVRIPATNLVLVPRRNRKWYAIAGLAAAAAMLAGILIWTGRTVPVPSEVPTASTTLAGIPNLTPEDRDLIDAALRTGTVAIPSSVAALGGRQGTLLGAESGSSSFKPVRPVGVAVDSTQPIFEWTTVSDATSYVVSVFDTNLETVAQSEPLSTTQWTLSKPLPRGRVYIWQVRARTTAGDLIAPAPPAPEARFLVLSDEEASRVAGLRERYAVSPLALGILLAHAGLLDEAQLYLKDAAAAKPSSEEVRRILADVQKPSPTTAKPAQ